MKLSEFLEKVNIFTQVHIIEYAPDDVGVFRTVYEGNGEDARTLLGNLASYFKVFKVFVHCSEVEIYVEVID